MRHTLNSELAYLRIARMHQETAQRRRAAAARGRTTVRYPSRIAARRHT